MASKKMRRTDPRIRQTLNQISHNLESANIATQTSLFSFSETYISPCLASFRSCLEASCHPCFAARDDLHQRKPHHRNARRARDHFAFEFYDDWNEEAGEWGNDELDRLLARSGDHQPGRHGNMSYGSRIIRRKSLGIPKDGNNDPTVVPSSSIFGFLERLPWKIGRRGRRYRPSAADLDENVGRGATRSEGDRLLDETAGDMDQGGGGGGGGRGRGRTGRNRSATTGSQSTTNSYSSRGDLFPSEDEADAVPIDDEFAMLLARRNTGTTTHTTNTTTTTTADDLSHHSSSHGGPNPTRAKRPGAATAAAAAGSQLSTKTTKSSSRTSKHSKTSEKSKNTKNTFNQNPPLRTSASTGSLPALLSPTAISAAFALPPAAEAKAEAEVEDQDDDDDDGDGDGDQNSPLSLSLSLSVPLSLSELKQEEEHVRDEEEAEIERKRLAARTLARRRGLGVGVGVGLSKESNESNNNDKNYLPGELDLESSDPQLDEFQDHEQEQEPKFILSPDPDDDPLSPSPIARPDPPLPRAQYQHPSTSPSDYPELDLPPSSDYPPDPDPDPDLIPPTPPPPPSP